MLGYVGVLLELYWVILGFAVNLLLRLLDTQPFSATQVDVATATDASNIRVLHGHLQIKRPNNAAKVVLFAWASHSTCLHVAGARI